MQYTRSKDGSTISKVREGINRIKKPAVLTALFANTKHKKLTQGTSGSNSGTHRCGAPSPSLGPGMRWQ